MSDCIIATAFLSLALAGLSGVALYSIVVSILREGLARETSVLLRMNIIIVQYEYARFMSLSALQIAHNGRHVAPT